MTLPFKPPLNVREQEVLTSLPKLHGAVVNPDYWPRESRERGEHEFLEWCDSHPVDDWPRWVEEWRFAYRIKHGLIAKTARGEGDVAGVLRKDAEGSAVAG